MLRELKAPHHQAERPLGRLSARAGHAVVQLGVFEGSEIEGEGLLENHLVDPLTKQRAQQLLTRAEPLLCACQHCHDCELHDDPRERRALVLHVAGLGRTNDCVDDQLAHPGGAGWKDTGYQAQGPEGEAQPTARRPHEGDPVSELTKHSEQLRSVQAGARIHRPSLGRSSRHAIALEKAPWYETSSTTGA